MVGKKCFGTACNGEIEIQLLTDGDLEGALNVISKSFLVKESAVVGAEINLPESEQARKDLLELCREVYTDGVSLVAKDIASGKVVSVAFNKVQVAGSPTDEPYFADFIKRRCRSPNSTSLINFMIEMDEQYDLFGNLEIDCLLEIMFLATLPEYEGRKIAQAVCSGCIDFARELKQGRGLDCVKDELKDRRIKAVSAIMTSRVSQSIGERLGMTNLNEVPYTKFSFNGKTYTERIGPNDPLARLVAIKLF